MGDGQDARSHWGWGLTGRFPDREARIAMGRQVAALLGAEPFEARDPVPLAEARLPAPRIAVPGALADLADVTPFARAGHTYGKGYPDLLRGFEGEFAHAPDAVVVPRAEDDLSRILEWAAGAKVAVVPYGGGSSVVAGVECDVGDRFAGAVSLDLRAFDRVLEADDVSRTARIQAGATGPHLEAQLQGTGLTLRHFPQSFEHSTLGGWIATRAAGHYATGPTHIDDRVASVRMVTPTGVWASRRLPGSGAGPSPDRLVLGSEGILGVITEAWVRLVPRPTFRASASVRFADFHPAAEAVRALTQSGLQPANCRLLDSREAMINGVASGGKAVLLLGFESADHPVDGLLARALELAGDHGGEVDPKAARKQGPGKEKANKRDEASTWRDAFLAAPYLFNTLVSLGVIVDTFETACPWDRFPALHAGVIHAMKDAMKRVTGGGLVTCRFTHAYPDGVAPYFTFVAPGSPGSQLAQWTELKAAASEAVLTHGGTIAHHHAVGRRHRPWYDRQRPAPFAAALKAAKGAVDPAGILNPGVLVD